jgi:release factor glutamine methyltransferase
MTPSVGTEVRKRKGVYHSAEDSELLRDVVSGYSGRSCLELGFGSGSNLPRLCERFELVVATDITRLEHPPERPACAELVFADRARCFKDSSFDFVVFNPPYLPSESIDDVTVDGGRGGIEAPLSFLEEAVRVVRKPGRILLLLSSECDLEEFVKESARLGVGMKLVRKRRMFYETLLVYEGRVLKSNQEREGDH